MKKIRNFGRVTFNRNKSQVEYTHFTKDKNGIWNKHHDQATIYNHIFIPTAEAVIKTATGSKGGLRKDFWGNPILSGVPCDFYDKNPPEVVKNNKKSFSSDISPVVKFLTEHFEFDEDKDEIPPLKVLYIDIETRIDDEGFLDAWRANQERGGVLLISAFNNINQKTTVFGIRPFNDTTMAVDDNVKYIYCSDERMLLREFMKYLKNEDPEIISGWNVSDYDIPYILNRLLYLFGDNALWHFGAGKAWIKQEARRFAITGISVVDYMILYKKFELTPRRSYSLANICEEEDVKVAGEGKHKFEGSMQEFCNNHWDKFVQYCIQDTRLVFEINQKKELMETFIMLCYMAGISFDSAIAQDISWLRIHDAAIYRYCQKKEMELPTAQKYTGEEENQFMGAYIMSPEPGLYDYVTVFDVASLYPSCIRSLNISIDAYRGKVVHIYTPGNEDAKFESNKGIYDNSFNLRPGKYEVEFYHPLYLSLKSSLGEIIERANESLKVKVDSKRLSPVRKVFASSDELLAFLKKNNLCIASNGTIYTNAHRGVIPSLLDDWIAIRKKNKKLYFDYRKKYQETGEKEYKQLASKYKTIQEVYKIRLNSLYGFIGTKWSRFFDTDLSEAVTLTGQFILRSTMSALKNHNILFSAMYCDTDSIFMNYGAILKHRGYKFEDKEACVAACLDIDNEVRDVITNHLNQVTSNMMNTPNYYSFESEEIYDKLLITSKKKYIARTLYDKVSKTFPDGDFNIKGMEFKKSNLSKPIKEMLKSLTIRIMAGMTEQETLAEFKSFWNKIPELPLDDVSFAQKVEGLDKYGSQASIVIKNEKEAIATFSGHTPYHVKGSLILNALLDWDPELRLMTRMYNGVKGKIVFVTPGNMFNTNVVVYHGEWHPKLYQYFKLDVEQMFLRLILQPLQPVLDAMKFHITLDSILGFKFVNGENTQVQMLLF
jgi:DNA polymerase elongation subunit (family B)